MADVTEDFKQNTTSNETSGGESGGPALDLCCETSALPQVETIEVEQVLGVEMRQKVLDIDVHVPHGMPLIDHVLDVYVKNVKIDSIKVLMNKVVIRGTFCIKVMYTAAGDGSQVTFFERRGIKFTRDIDVDGACPNMKATADVRVEYMQYDFDPCVPHRVDVTVVLKLWTRVTTSANLSVEALPGVDVVGNFDSGSVEGCETEAEISVGEMTTQGSAELKSGYVTGNRVNLRTGPGTNYPSLMKLNRGDAVKIQEQAFGWYKVLLPDSDTDGWIAGWFVDMKE